MYSPNHLQITNDSLRLAGLVYRSRRDVVVLVEAAQGPQLTEEISPPKHTNRLKSSQSMYRTQLRHSLILFVLGPNYLSILHCLMRDRAVVVRPEGDNLTYMPK